jgi:hypothetical protein
MVYMVFGKQCMPGEERGMKDIAQMYSVVDEVFGFVRGRGHSMEIGEVERNLIAILMRVGKRTLRTECSGVPQNPLACIEQFVP